MNKIIAKCYKIVESDIYHAPNDCTHILKVYKIKNKLYFGIFNLKGKKEEKIFESEYKKYQILFDRFIFIEQTDSSTKSTIAFVFDPVERSKLVLTEYTNKKKNTTFSIETVDGLLEIIGQSNLFVFSHCLTPDFVGVEVNSTSDNKIVKQESKRNWKINIIGSESLRKKNIDEKKASMFDYIIKKFKK